MRNISGLHHGFCSVCHISFLVSRPSSCTHHTSFVICHISCSIYHHPSSMLLGSIHLEPPAVVFLLSFLLRPLTRYSAPSLCRCLSHAVSYPSLSVSCSFAPIVLLLPLPPAHSSSIHSSPSAGHPPAVCPYSASRPSCFLFTAVQPQTTTCPPPLRCALVGILVRHNTSSLLTTSWYRAL
jgi:hypothetical protein